MKRRLIASLLAVCLVAGLLPTVALAAEPCTATVGCTREAGHEGDCVLPSANNDAGEAGDEVDGEPASANDETSGMNTDTNNVPAPMDDADSNAYYETIDVIDPVDITAVESVGEQPVKIGETGYSTLADAVNAAGTNGVGTDIITLTADITLTGSIIVPEKATFTIKGEGHTIQFPAGGVFKQIDKNNLEGVTDVNLTFENVNFENTAGEKNGYAVITGFDASGVTLNFTGCTFTNMWDAVYSNVISDTNVSQNVVNITIAPSPTLHGSTALMTAAMPHTIRQRSETRSPTTLPLQRRPAPKALASGLQQPPSPPMVLSAVTPPWPPLWQRLKTAERLFC